jgi:hypothetical protein
MGKKKVVIKNKEINNTKTIPKIITKKKYIYFTKFNVFLILLIIFILYNHYKIEIKKKVEEVAPNIKKPWSRSTKVGLELKNKGYRKKHPIVIIPGSFLLRLIFFIGCVTTKLELWKGKNCTEGLFRDKWWGTSYNLIKGGYEMIKELLTDRFCWLEHMQLNRTTGLDPSGIKLRALEGLGGIDYLVPGKLNL